jgi:ribosomal-protein-alanine acetyltransferase
MQTDERSRPNVRHLRPADITAVVQIIGQSPEAADWSRASVEEFLGLNGIVALASENRSQVTGFFIGRQIADEAEILNLAVSPASRRCGHGSVLLLAALEEFERRRATRIFLEVRASNSSALAFYRKHGFIESGRRQGYYRNPDEDALIMEKT